MATLLFRFHALRRLAPLAMLVLLLQRTPIIQLFLKADPRSSTAIVNLLRTALLGVSAGAAHTLTGATTSLFLNPNPAPGGTVGQVYPGLIFTVTGAQTSPGSFRISGSLPPGLTILGMNTTTGVLNASSGSLSGTPTTAGTFIFNVKAWQLPDLGGDADTTTFDITVTISPGGSPPAISSHPSSTTVTVGANVSFSVTATGTGTLTYQWRKDGTNIGGATASTLNLSNVQLSAAGAYTVVVTNSSGSVTSNAATLTVNAGPTAPTITTQPRAFHVPVGFNASFSVVATGTAPLTYQWKKDGTNIGGATSATLAVSNAQLSSAGNYSVVITNAQGSATSSDAALVVGTSGGRVPALSMRARVGTGSEILVPGLVVGGSTPQQFLVRALGPKLGDFGIPIGSFLADPLLKVTQLDGTIIDQNDDWSTNANSATIVATTATLGAQPLTNGSKDAVLLVTLPPGIYTPQISGVGGTTGIALVEFYNVDPSNRVPAISMRARVGTGSEILVPGLIVEGTAPKMFVVRALGPKLGDFGIPSSSYLGDPLLRITKLDGTVVGENDNWSDSANANLLDSISISLGAQPLTPGSKDAAMLIALPPGIYTPQISGVGSTTGVSLVEFYNVE